MEMYNSNDHWHQLPPAWSWTEVAGVACDSQDRVFVFNRGEHPVIIFDRDGKFVANWGEGVFVRPHGITIGPDDAVYCTDDNGHVVRKFSSDGRLLLTLGSGKPSDTGAQGNDYRTIRRAGPPFNCPTNLALAGDGTMFICDGYGNARVHVFSPDGRLLRSWGEPGSGPGQFHLPHGIAVDRHGTVYVADRENSRVELFTAYGAFIESWTDVIRPCQVFVEQDENIFVAELGLRAGLWSGMPAPGPDTVGGRVSVFNRHGELLARWGGGRNPCAPGDFFAPHDICVDSHGAVYVGEVTWSGGANKGIVPADCHSLQKFTPV